MKRSPTTRQEVARDNPELLRDYQQLQAESVAREFRRLNPRYYKCPENWEPLVQCLGFNCLQIEPDEQEAKEIQEKLIITGHFTLPNLTAAFEALDRAGSLEPKPGQPRSLTQHEKRMIALQASNDIEAAIVRYLRLRLPEDTTYELEQMFAVDDVMDRLADPELARLVEEAVWFCWENARGDYSPTDERRRFMKEYIAGRIPTVRLLDEAWVACKAAEKEATRAGILRQVDSEEEARPTADELDNLSDEAIDQLYHGTLRWIAAQARRSDASY